MSDLAAFWRARLDEDEAAAKAAAKVEPEDAETSRWYGHAQWVARYGTVVDADDDDYAMMTESTDEVCAHIARHDPARVLREVEAKREILMAYEDRRSWADDDDPDTMSSNPEWEKGAAAALYAAVCLLAAVDRDHPDYDEAWNHNRGS